MLGHVCIGIVDHRYDTEFRRQRKLSLSILKDFGFGKDIMEERIQTEVSVLLEKIRDIKSAAFSPDSVVLPCALNVVVSIMFGRRMEDRAIGDFSKVSYKFMHSVIEIVAADVLPVLGFLPQMRRRVATTIDLQNQVFGIIRSSMETSEEDSFVRYYEKHESSSLDREQLEYTVRDLLLSSMETVTSTLLWALVFLAGREGQRVQARLWKEIESQVPRERLPSLADRPRLLFLEATILEVMRIRTVFPLSLGHWTSCDTTAGGFFIPANTLASISAGCVDCHFSGFCLKEKMFRS